MNPNIFNQDNLNPENKYPKTITEQLQRVHSLLKGNPRKAVEAYYIMTGIYDEISDEYIWQMIYTCAYLSIWDCYTNAQYESMERFARIALKLFIYDENYPDRKAKIYNGLALALHKLGQPHLEYNLLAKEIFDDILTKNPDAAGSLSVIGSKIRNDIGIIIEWGFAGKWEKSIEMIEKNIPLAQKHNLTLESAQLYKIYGELLYHKKDINESIFYFKKAIDLLKDRELAPFLKEKIKVLSLLSNNYVELNQYDDAAFYLDECKHLSYQTGYKSYLFNYLTGFIHETRGDFHNALKSYLRAIKHIQPMKEDISTVSLMDSFLKRRNHEQLYIHTISMCIKNKRYKAAYYFLELYRSAILRKAIMLPRSSQVREDFDKASIDYLQKSYESILDQINDHEMHKSDKGESSRESDQQLIILKDKLYFASERLSACFNRIDSSFKTKPVSLSEIMRTLEKGRSYLAFFQDRESIYYLWITYSGIKIIENQVPALKLHKAMQGYIRLITDFNRDKSSMKMLSYYGRNLYNLLITPVERILKEEDELVIIPYGMLNNFPIMSLIGNAADYSVISFMPSVSISYHLPCTPSQWKKGLVAGNPTANLRASAEEAEYIAGLDKSIKLLSEGNATRENVKSLALDSDFFHYSGHIHYNKRKPFYSYLELAPEKNMNKDGFSDNAITDKNLSLFDLLTMSFDNLDFVSLGGCSSGRSTLYRGEEQIGFIRGFLMGGVKSVLATLWDIEDVSAGRFITAFYKHLLVDNQSVKQSYKNTLIEMQKQYDHPYYFAGYVLYQGFYGA